MSDAPTKYALAALALKQEQTSAVKPLVASIRSELFKQQLNFLDDPSHQKAALCTRRAGKTSMWARYLTIEALQNPRALYRVWATSRLRTKQLLWSEFSYLFARHGIEAKFHDTELTITLANGAEIRLVGADKDREAQKKRGDKTNIEVVLEAQLFGPFLKSLVEDVVEPCLFDTRGTLCLEGTPGPLCVGYWFCVSGGEGTSRQWVSKGGEDGTGAGWSVHRWSVLDNPHLQHAKDELEKIKRKKQWTDDNPTYMREWCAQWVDDKSTLYYAFDPVRNLHHLTQEQLTGSGWNYVLGWDIGFRDDMAIVVWAWHNNDPVLYEAESWKEKQALSGVISTKIREFETRYPNMIAKVADTGGAGRLFVEEVQARFGLHFKAAEKTQKYAHVQLMNDALLSGLIKLRPGSVLHEEMRALPKDPDWPYPDQPESAPKEHPGYPNHACDAALYSWRAAQPYLAVIDNTPRYEKGTIEYDNAERRQLEERFIRDLERPGRAWWDTDHPFNTEEV